MLVPVHWIKDYTDIATDIDTLCEEMIMSGSNIETVEAFGEGIKDVVVGRIADIEKHPDADKLLVTQIDIGEEELVQIVTGADNIFEGAYVPVVLHGGRLPGDKVIKKGRLRGVESNGMLCSAGELGFSDKVVPVSHKEGIWILDKEYSLGQDIVEALGLKDQVIDFEITPNRPDCLSMIGMAREVAATFKSQLRYPDTLCQKEEGKAEDHIDIEIKKPDLCRRYIGRVVTDVKIEESPWWLQKKLIYAGMRPINNIVDITNYVMLEYGQPIHAFDIRDIQDNKIIVDTAAEGESFTTLDGTERKLGSDMLLIKDGLRSVAIAGVMGGLNSEIKEDTTTILVEAANFSGDSVRSTSKKLGLRTEASARFEKGIDPNLCQAAADRVCRLIEILGAGKVTAGSVDVYPAEWASKAVLVRVERVNKMLGISLEEKAMTGIFTSLEMKVEATAEGLLVTPPTIRQDLLEEIDFVEEIARIYGYNNLPLTLPKGNSESGKSRERTLRDLARDTMTALGANEIQTYSFVSPKGVDHILLGSEANERNFVKLINPLGEENSVMRTTLIPNLLEVLGRNFSRNISRVQAFEIGNTFFNHLTSPENLPEERDSMVVGCYGEGESFYTIKGRMEALFAKLGMVEVSYVPEMKSPTYHPGRCARLTYQGETLGVMGELHPDVAENYGIGTKCYCCEINFKQVIQHANIERFYTPLPKYPAIVRDIALVVKEEVTVATIENLIKETGGKLLESKELFDVYRGPQVQAGMKSVAFTLTYRSWEKTLTDEEVAKTHGKIIEVLREKLDAVLRDI